MMSSLRILPLLGLLSLSLRAAETPPPQVKVVVPHRGDITRYITLPGSLRANQQVTLYAKVPGYLKSIAVDKGDLVKAGQPLVEIETPELTAERTRYEVELRLANADLTRLESARANSADLITPQSVDTAEGRVAAAKANLDRTETLLRYAHLTSPFDGAVTMRALDPGAFVPAATASTSPTSAAILTVMDFKVVRAQVAVPEIEAARIRVGEPVLVVLEAIPGRTFQGTVSRQSYALDEATRSLGVEADLPNPDLVLRPGMYAAIKVGVEQHTGALLVPANAIVREKANAFVFTLADGRANRISVKMGFNDGANAEILEGLAENARVILPGTTVLVPGQTVAASEGP